MKIFLISAAVFSLVAQSYAADGEKTVQELQDEIAVLKASLIKAQNQNVTNFSTTVQIRAKYDTAVERVNQANDVARQWRAQAINLRHELIYTKAVAQATNNVDLEKVYANSSVPHFRISNIASREEPVIPPTPLVQPSRVIPNYISMR